MLALAFPSVVGSFLHGCSVGTLVRSPARKAFPCARNGLTSEMSAVRSKKIRRVRGRLWERWRATREARSKAVSQIDASTSRFSTPRYARVLLDGTNPVVRDASNRRSNSSSVFDGCTQLALDIPQALQREENSRYPSYNGLTFRA